MSILPPAVVGKHGEKAHINLYETFSVRAHRLNITSCVSIKGSSWIQKKKTAFLGAFFFSRLLTFPAGNVDQSEMIVVGIAKTFWWLANSSVSVVTQPCGSAAAFCCVILVCVVISNGPSFHSSQVSWLFPFPCNLGKPKLFFLCIYIDLFCFSSYLCSFNVNLERISVHILHFKIKLSLNLLNTGLCMLPQTEKQAHTAAMKHQ